MHVGACPIVIFVIVYGRMIEIYLTVSLAPIPFSTMANREWGQMGTGYLRSLFALGVPGIFDPGLRRHLCGALVQSIPASGDIHGAIWGTAGYTVLLWPLPCLRQVRYPNPYLTQDSIIQIQNKEDFIL